MSQPGNVHSSWRLLHIFNLYRITLSGLMVILIFSGKGYPTVGSLSIVLFKITGLVYLAICLINSFTIRERMLPIQQQVFILTITDISAIVLLTHASGGLNSGLGMLLVVAIAGSCIMMMERKGVLFAAIASIAILLDEIYLSNVHGIKPSYTLAGILGASLFATAILITVLANRIRESESLAERRGIDLADMKELNEYIIQHMQTGIVVIDEHESIRLLNESAKLLLESDPYRKYPTLEALSPQLYEQYLKWRESPQSSPEVFRASDTGNNILPGFAPLGKKQNSGVLIFLDNASAMSQRAQQIKLASLGRLTASIAHEIRNPLGAISHASQLLDEADPGNTGVTTRLTQIIHDNTQRVNRIIERILGLSRREPTSTKRILLKPWLWHFVDEFTKTHEINPDDIKIDFEDDDIEVRIDPLQLHQVIWNLCINAIRYSAAYEGSPKVILRADMQSEHQSPYLDIIDMGQGIDPDKVEDIFEPFFTTDNSGTGLGLYIARELCEGNQARLDYLPADKRGTCFRITFANPDKRQVA
jgi:two-component system sensor histidine kinase PilS (NtrC family)